MSNQKQCGRRLACHYALFHPVALFRPWCYAAEIYNNEPPSLVHMRAAVVAGGEQKKGGWRPCVRTCTWPVQGAYAKHDRSVAVCHFTRTASVPRCIHSCRMKSAQVHICCVLQFACVGQFSAVGRTVAACTDVCYQEECRVSQHHMQSLVCPCLFTMPFCLCVCATIFGLPAAATGPAVVRQVGV